MDLCIDEWSSEYFLFLIQDFCIYHVYIFMFLKKKNNKKNYISVDVRELSLPERSLVTKSRYGKEGARCSC